MKESASQHHRRFVEESSLISFTVDDSVESVAGSLGRSIDRTRFVLHADKYRDFEDLRAHEAEGKDFAVSVEPRDGPVAVIAPHGGKIETGTSQIAAAIAADRYSLYRFEGRKNANNRHLHITSTNFDEPRCRELVTRCDAVIAVHGLDGVDERIDVGGLDHGLRDRITANLQRAGFRAGIVASGPYAAISGDNICNRGRTGAGVQLEITRGLRDALKANEARLQVFARAVREAIGG